jgi:predicted nucleic acid-binding protein
MPRVTHVRDVPDDVHDAPREAAEARGLSLTRYVLHGLEQLAKRSHVVHENATVARETQARVRGGAPLEGFIRLTLFRYPADWVRTRTWTLRHNINAYDATYVALAEMTGVTALLTTDARLAKAPGVRCAIQVL